jgi:hypothetical protein
MTTTRLLLRISLVAVAALMVVLLLIQSQPNNDYDLHALFARPDNCPLCFTGIRPGTTTVAESITILKAHPWVKSINALLDQNAQHRGQLVITWSGMQPFLIDTQAQSVFYTCGELVCGLSIATKLEYGSILLALGQPDSAILRSIPGAPHILIAQTATYIQKLLTVRVHGVCPPLFTAMALHHGLVTLQMGDVNEHISINLINMANFQMITFQKRPYPWLLRRAFVCQS